MDVKEEEKTNTLRLVSVLARNFDTETWWPWKVTLKHISVCNFHILFLHGRKISEKVAKPTNKNEKELYATFLILLFFFQLCSQHL